MVGTHVLYGPSCCGRGKIPVRRRYRDFASPYVWDAQIQNARSVTSGRFYLKAVSPLTRDPD